MSPTIMSGSRPCSRIASAPPSTADQHRLLVADVGPQRCAGPSGGRRRARRSGTAGRGTSVSNSGRSSRPASSSRSSRMWLIVFSANASSASPSFSAARSCACRHRVELLHLALEQRLAVAQHVAAADRDLLAVAQLVEQGAPGRSTRCTPASARISGPDVRIARRSTSAPRSARSARREATRSSPETRSMSSWSITAMSPGREALDEPLRALSEPRAARELGRARPTVPARARAPRSARSAATPPWSGPRLLRPQATRESGRRTLRGSQQLLRVLAGAGVLRVGAQHAAELVDHERRPRARSTVVRASSPAASFSIRKWRSRERGDLRQVRDAQRPGGRRRGARSRSPTARAVWPPTPASTSSNTSVRRPAGCSATDISASITRESSPPDAVSRSGAAGTPGLGAIRNSTCSAPVAAELVARAASSTSNDASSIASSASSARTRSASRGAAFRRAFDSAPASACSSRLRLRERALGAPRSPPRRSRAARARRGSARRARAPPRRCRRACARAGRSASSRSSTCSSRPGSRLQARLVAAQLAARSSASIRSARSRAGEPVELGVDARHRVGEPLGLGQERRGAPRLVRLRRERLGAAGAGGAQPLEVPQPARAPRRAPPSRPRPARAPRSPRSRRRSRSRSRSRAPARRAQLGELARAARARARARPRTRARFASCSAPQNASSTSSCAERDVSLRCSCWP